MKICFPLMGGDSWHAGEVYLAGLFHALRETRTENLTLCLLTASTQQVVPDELVRLTDEIITFPPLQRWTARWAIDAGCRRLFRWDLMESFALRRHSVEMIAFRMAPRGSRIPVLGWLPDFQHVHLPEMFSLNERQARDRSFREIAKRSARIMLLSETAGQDYQAFAPAYTHKMRIVSPVSYVPPSVYKEEPESICDMYRLPDKFIYLPNQFWKHKNHLTAFRALKFLKAEGVEVFLVCSGHPGDYRHHAYFGDLLQELSQHGIWKQVAFIGLIPRSHVFAVMRQSVCVLNPSLFEGYGLSVDEARSLGKQTVLSDIPAHREQDPPQAIFFNPQDTGDLAEKLKRLWREKSPGPDEELELEARGSLPARTQRYAESFLSVVKEVLHR